MKRKIMFTIILLMAGSNLLLTQAKNDPYVEAENQDWGDLSNPAAIWSSDAAIVHAGRLQSASDVDAFTVSFADPKAEFAFEIYVPVCGQHFADFRPSVALIGPGLQTPPAGTLPFDLPQGMGARVFADDRSLNGARIAVPANNVTGDNPVYATNSQKFSVPQAASYTLTVWEPDGRIGAYMLSTGEGGDTFGSRPQAERDASFNDLFSGAWMGQDCNAPLTLAGCATDSSSASPAVKNPSDSFVLTGIVRDVATCQPISTAKLSYFVLGSYTTFPNGKVTTDDAGSYQIESAMFDSYKHILVTITAPGYQMAVADYALGTHPGSAATFDLALQSKPKP
ncbi:MAG: carboxypeptidase-like regulatory domain-containing protein [Chloroflexota bacterium]